VCSSDLNSRQDRKIITYLAAVEENKRFNARKYVFNCGKIEAKLTQLK